MPTASPPQYGSLDPSPKRRASAHRVRQFKAPFRATVAFALSFAAASLALAGFRIHALQRYDLRWSPELHWALECVTWPFVGLLALVLFCVAASLRRVRTDPWPRALAFGVGLAVLVAAPSILGAQVSAPLGSSFTWLLVLAGPLFAGANLEQARRTTASTDRSA